MFIYIPPPKKETAPLPIPTGNASPIDVRQGKSFSSAEGTEVFGTLPERSSGPLAVVPDRTTQTKTAGIYNGDIIVQPIPSNLIDTSDANAIPFNILLGQTAYVNGQKITGTMYNWAGKTLGGAASSALSGDRVIIVPNRGYYDEGSKLIALTPGLTPANIKKGIDILGIVGTLEPSAPQKQDLGFYSDMTTRPGSGASTVELFTIPAQANLGVFSRLISETGLSFTVVLGSYPSYEMEITDGIRTIGFGSNNSHWAIDTVIINKITSTLTYKYASSSTTITNRSISLTELDRTKDFRIRAKLYIDGGGSTWQVRAGVNGTLLMA